MESNVAQSIRVHRRRPKQPPKSPPKPLSIAYENDNSRKRKIVSEVGIRGADDDSCVSIDVRASNPPQNVRIDMSANREIAHFHEFERNDDTWTLEKRLPADRNPARAYIASLAMGSRRTMKQALRVIAHLLSNGRAGPPDIDWSQIRFQHTSAVRSALAERYKPPTSNKILSALRGVLKAAWRLSLLDAESYHRAIDLPAVKGSSLPRGRALDAGEIGSLFGACCDRTNAGTRDAAILGVLFGCGLRRSEVVALDVSAFDTSAGSLAVRKAKGNRERIAYPPNGALEAIRDWILLRGDADGPLFVPVNKGDRILIRRMTDQAVWNLIVKRAREACVSRFTPHDLRRSFVSTLLDAGVDISSVQALAGHASVSTTCRYDMRGEATKRRSDEATKRRRGAPRRSCLFHTYPGCRRRTVEHPTLRRRKKDETEEREMKKELKTGIPRARLRKLTSAVSRGARHLDSVVPGWAARIDLTRFRFRSLQNSIGGQLFPKTTTEEGDPGGLYRARRLWGWRLLDALRHGFCSSAAKEVPFMEQRWIEEVEARRGRKS
jgi:site-specific recombinase XerD